MNAIGYARTSRYEKEPMPVKIQRDQIRTYAECYDYDLVAFYNDVGFSGKNISTHPGLQRVLEAVVTQRIDAVIVYSFDRLSHYNLQRLHIKQLFLESGVRYLSCTEDNLATGTVDDTLRDLMLEIARLQRHESNRQRARQRIQIKIERGDRLGSNPRYGYRVVDRELVEDQDEQRLVQRVRELRERGEKTTSITETINIEGFRTRNKKTPFVRNQILRIINALPVEEINS